MCGWRISPEERERRRKFYDLGLENDYPLKKFLTKMLEESSYNQSFFKDIERTVRHVAAEKRDLKQLRGNHQLHGTLRCYEDLCNRNLKYIQEAKEEFERIISEQKALGPWKDNDGFN